jgi:acylphosphatase
MLPEQRMPRLHVVIYGRVQGVGFRHFVVRQAAVLGLKGWVRNRDDGSVELEAHGSAGALASLLEAVRRGPLGAQVTGLDESWSESEGSPVGFRVVG